MASSKLTFTLDEVTARHIADAAIRLKKPKSQVVREAVSLYHERIGKLTEAERLRMLRVINSCDIRVMSGCADRVYCLNWKH